MDGLDLLRAIRAIKDCVVFFILLTAYGTVSVAVEAITDGADEVLTKPLDEEALCVMLQRVEDAKRKRAKV
jgi:ActR/RegA family two-component response regulator